MCIHDKAIDDGAAAAGRGHATMRCMHGPAAAIPGYGAARATLLCYHLL
jgi:hypothetical protein